MISLSFKIERTWCLVIKKDYLIGSSIWANSDCAPSTSRLHDFHRSYTRLCRLLFPLFSFESFEYFGSLRWSIILKLTVQQIWIKHNKTSFFNAPVAYPHLFESLDVFIAPPPWRYGPPWICGACAPYSRSRSTLDRDFHHEKTEKKNPWVNLVTSIPPLNMVTLVTRLLGLFSSALLKSCPFENVSGFRKASFWAHCLN